MDMVVQCGELPDASRGFPSASVGVFCDYVHGFEPSGSKDQHDGSSDFQTPFFRSVNSKQRSGRNKVAAVCMYTYLSCIDAYQ